jgi:NleD-like pathogen effector protein (putative zinc metallopeptidase)
MAPRNDLDNEKTFHTLRTTKSPAELKALQNPTRQNYRANMFIEFPAFRPWLQRIDRRPHDQNLDDKLTQYYAEKGQHFHSIKDLLDNNVFAKWSSTGAALAAEIARAKGHVLTFSPMDWDADTASAHADDTTDGTMVEEWVRDGDGDRIDFPAKSGANAPHKGGAKGTDVTIRFSPSFYTVRSVANQINAKPPPWKAQDVVLLHEMVHAAAYLNGVMSARPIREDFDTETEFMAILIGNIYMSEGGATRLRGSHHDVMKALAHPETFLDNYPTMTPSPREIIDRFKFHQMAFYSNLAWIPIAQAKFNPLRQTFWENSGPPGQYQNAPAGAPAKW